mmetsp:Transcript_34603/g.99684  ORF Transcript_34603/g.99684 Transcript_34603/m.99684 type:complete len:251 (-) Transcript_34603:76-828(-)
MEVLTREFRFDALQLCQQSPTAASWHIAQHLLDGLWSSEPHADKDMPVVHLCCQCGATIHPGWRGSSLRVSRLCSPSAAKTRRRRMQRQRRRELIAQSKRARDTNKNTQPKNKLSSSSQVPAKALLRDDSGLLFDRHHLEVKCGNCQAKVRLKGLKRETPLTKIDIQRRQITFEASSSKSKAKNEKKPASTENFLELPPAPKASEAKAHGRQTSHLSNAHKPSKGGKKKKAGGGNNKKSNLMSFLSSLND